MEGKSKGKKRGGRIARETKDVRIGIPRFDARLRPLHLNTDVCLCVCACMRVRVHACVRVCVRVKLRYAFCHTEVCHSKRVVSHSHAPAQRTFCSSTTAPPDAESAFILNRAYCYAGTYGQVEVLE